MGLMTEPERLQKAIKDVHGCDSDYVESVPISETYRGKLVWEGHVDVFLLKRHPKADKAYAWSYKTDTGETRYVAVLKIPPISSALDAVRAYVLAQVEKQN
jgi:hypothetical protein